MTVIDFCQRLIQTDSTPGREGAAVELAAQEMRDLGFDEVTVDPHGNLIGRVGDPGSGPVLLVDGHIDTIPIAAEDRWTYPPLSGTVADGRIWALARAT